MRCKWEEGKAFQLLLIVGGFTSASSYPNLSVRTHFKCSFLPEDFLAALGGFFFLKSLWAIICAT